MAVSVMACSTDAEPSTPTGDTARVELGAAGIFDVSAGIPVRSEIDITSFDRTVPGTLLAAVLRLQTEDITVTDPVSAKSQAGASPATKSGPTGEIRVRVVMGSKGFGFAGVDLFDPRQDLGVITVSVNDGRVVGVKPEQLTIAKPVLDDILSRLFKVGVEVLATFDGEIQIKGFNIDFGMTEDDPQAPQQRRACCFARSGPPQCLDIGFVDALRTAEDCADNLNGVALGVGTACGVAPCAQDEACCLPAGECDVHPPLLCRDRGGEAQGAGVQCSDVECPLDTQDCSMNDDCNTMCPDVEPDPDCSNAELCASEKEFCCDDLICDIRRCNEPDSDCTNSVLCDLRYGCCPDDDRCDTTAGSIQCPQPDQDCDSCATQPDEVCIRGCTPPDPDCPNEVDCPEDNRCEADCPGWDADCPRCLADPFGSCIANCDQPDPDCFVVTNITAEGTVFASSTFRDESEYLPFRATDGSASTNWFSDGKGGDGPDADSESFTWLRNLSGNTSITRIETDPETFAEGAFGFSFVEVRVLNAADETVFFSDSLAQTNSRVDLNVSVPEDTEGNRVVLTLIGHEDPSCGGFAELRIFGLRD